MPTLFPVASPGLIFILKIASPAISASTECQFTGDCLALSMQRLRHTRLQSQTRLEIAAIGLFLSRMAAASSFFP